MKILKRNYKLLVGIIIGAVFASVGAYAATSYAIDSSKIGYKDNSNLGVDNVQAAIDGTCANVDTTLSKKLDKSWISIPVPTPTISTDTSGNVVVKYDIDLSNYTEFAPSILVKDYFVYDFKIYPVPTDGASSLLYWKSTMYDGVWSGVMSFTPSYIQFLTYASSSNVNVNYFEMPVLYVR